MDPVADLKEEDRYGESEDNIQITNEAEALYKEKFIEWHMDFGDITDQYEEA